MPVSRSRSKNKPNPKKKMSNQNRPAKQGTRVTQPVSYQQTHIKGEIFHSNYPPPEMLEKYAQVDSTFPSRLIGLAEEEGRHRRKLEKRLMNFSVFLDTLGILLGFAAVAGVLYVGYLFMKNNNPNSGATIITGISVALAFAFISRGKKNLTK